MSSSDARAYQRNCDGLAMLQALENRLKLTWALYGAAFAGKEHIPEFVLGTSRQGEVNRGAHYALCPTEARRGCSPMPLSCGKLPAQIVPNKAEFVFIQLCCTTRLLI